MAKSQSTWLMHWLAPDDHNLIHRVQTQQKFKKNCVGNFLEAFHRIHWVNFAAIDYICIIQGSLSPMATSPSTLGAIGDQITQAEKMCFTTGIKFL
jgi:hypothetical protein